MKDLAVSGMGAVSALGFGCAALWDAVAEGRDGIRPFTRFDTAEFHSRMGALVPGCDAVEQHRLPTGDDWALWMQYGLAAAREALEEARVADVPRHRVALVVGSLRGHEHGVHDFAEALGDALGIAGPRINVATACAASTHAIALAADLVASGAADLVLAGGCDVVTLDMFAGFDALALLSTEKCAPFSSPEGTTLGEGAAFLVLESAERARARDLAPVAFLRGYGLSADAHHATTPDPSGAGVARALEAAISDGGVTPGYVNAHGTGTASNDAAEWRAVERVLGSSILISGSKSYFGHAQGAAGALEAVTTLLAFRRGLVPPTLHFRGPRPRGPLDPVADPRPRAVSCEAVLSLNSAFGGANAALLFARSPSTVERARREVSLLGAALLDRAIAADELPREVPMADPRGLDPTTLTLSAVAARALADAKISVRGPLRERTGLFVGSARLSPYSGRTYEESLEHRAQKRLSAIAFTRIVLNAPAGACARLLSLRGPTTVVAGGPTSGLLALLAALEHLSRHPAADRLIAAAADERTEDEPLAREGGAALVLGSDGGPVRAAGWAIAGPGRLDDAVEGALAAAGLTSAERILESDRGMASASSLSAAVRAFEALRKREIESALVVDAGGRAAACALVLVAEGG